MIKMKRLLLIFLCIILAISLLTACQPKPATTEPESGVETEKPEEASPAEGEEKPQEQEPAEETKKVEEETPPVTSVTSPAEPDKIEIKVPDVPKPADESSLQIEGSGVENTVILSLDDLKAMKDSFFEDDFYSLNSYGTREHFHFKGIKVKALLDKAVLKSDAKNIKFVATDGYAQELTVELALKEDYIDQDNPGKKFPVIIAWHENGKDFDVKKGAPFRLVVGQKEVDDMNKPQWVSNIAKIIVD